MEREMATSQEHDHEHEHEVRKSFDEHMTDIKSDVIRVAAMAGEMVGMATDALLDKELLLVERVVESNRRLDELNLSEAALLAAVVANPEGDNPFTNPAGALERRSETLDAMVEGIAG